MNPLKLQPIPYQGSKRALAPRIAKLFPSRISTIYEPFAGSAAMSLYAAQHGLADRFVLGDIFPELIDLWGLIIERPSHVAERYRAIWEAQHKQAGGHFNAVRASYNASRDPVELLYLIARCVKNAVRFNKSGHFTQSADKRRFGMHPDKMAASVTRASALLKGRTLLFKGDFAECISAAGKGDLVYMDPPYQGTTYGSDKRYAAQLERERLVESLINLNGRGVPYILSYDGRTGDKEYGPPMPESVRAEHLYINAGRSSQATLAGRDEVTFESLYVSHQLAKLHKTLPDYSKKSSLQQELFAK